MFSLHYVQPFAGQMFSCTMLSTAQAQKEWERAHTLLGEIRAHAAAHPDDPTLPTSLATRVEKKHAFFVERVRLPCCHLQAAAENQGEQTDLDVIDSSLQRGSKHTL
jgi:hypothetical protein